MSNGDRKKNNRCISRYGILSQKVGFEKPFPEINIYVLKLKKEGEGVNEWSKIRHYGKDSADEYINHTIYFVKTECCL